MKYPFRNKKSLTDNVQAKDNSLKINFTFAA